MEDRIDELITPRPPETVTKLSPSRRSIEPACSDVRASSTSATRTRFDDGCAKELLIEAPRRLYVPYPQGNVV